MRKNVRVGIWGYGAMGKGIANMLLKKKGVTVVGVCDVDEHLVGKGFLDFLSVESDHENHCIVSDVDALLHQAPMDVMIIATDSFTKKTFSKIVTVIEHGVNVISTAEEMAFPMANEPELSQEIDGLAKKNQVTVLGTGINPGFIMDLLVLALTGCMEEVQHIEAERVNSLSPFGPTVMEEQGVGISLETYHQRMEAGTLAGHVGFKESVHMIASGLGVKLSHFEQQMKPIVSNTNRKSKYGEVQPGHLAGIDMSAQGHVSGKSFISMKHPQQIEPEVEGTATGDYIRLRGIPNISMSINPEIDGGIGTIAMCVNMIPHVINATPGLKTMLDLPVPRAILGDMRNMLE
ncbi:MAG: NADP-binding protein [Acholeplasmatales bacterium]|nr:MAG: NADP-binding protein [Acholeplasmatales bacterium]